MRKLKRIIAITACAVYLSGACAHADELSERLDTFYNGLADIIEKNMNDAKQCLAAVEDYYKKNKEVIDRIKELTEQAMKDAMELAKKYVELTEKEIEALKSKESGQEPSESTAPASIDRYSKLLRDFAVKHPQEGVKVTIKAMDLMPGD